MSDSESGVRGRQVPPPYYASLHAGYEAL